MMDINCPTVKQGEIRHLGILRSQPTIVNRIMLNKRCDHDHILVSIVLRMYRRTFQTRRAKKSPAEQNKSISWYNLA